MKRHGVFPCAGMEASGPAAVLPSDARMSDIRGDVSFFSIVLSKNARQVTKCLKSRQELLLYAPEGSLLKGRHHATHDQPHRQRQVMDAPLRISDGEGHCCGPVDSFSGKCYVGGPAQSWVC